ncbi:ribonucleotide reductase of class Ia (aerobic), beta subunit [Chloriridovirus anopheles1]|uniref:ribonucleoside-diphosphate reductase n=1 Tax=Chloriridovirus anopheles1 TaxID=1465751 RepID=W8QE57_9VIRU|nr:ribonucleotide reductase of class Ia (aerobic), beta subunit [Anopheles minimus iridovirus]AHL67580.1 ribonucleotide reductase of class Ia (aerobic), beta subunit [Anopheles minimus iridovirus]
MIVTFIFIIATCAYFFRKRGKYPEIKLMEERTSFKPFEYPGCYEKWDLHEHAHWSFKELNMQDDVNDWINNLADSEKTFLIQILRYFTQGDVDVAAGYVYYLQMFKQPEVRMMLFGFGAREAMHIASYSHLITTLNLPDVTYQEFLRFKEMKDKHEFVFNRKFKSHPVTRFVKYYLFGYDEKLEEIAVQIALFSAFIEGVQLFSSFIMLLNFTRHGLMKKMGQIIQWSIADETHHTNSMMSLYRTFVSENKKYIREDVLQERVYLTAQKIVELEDNFIDLAFKMGPMRDLKAEEVKLYIRYITDRRLSTLGYNSLFNVPRNPLEWVEDLLNAPTHTNFFENKPTEYAKASLTGDWPW